jgi:hypothetical protein
MLNRDAIPELVDQYQACILLGISRSHFSERAPRCLLTPVSAPAWRKRRRKAGEKRPRGRPPGYQVRLYRRDDVIDLRMMRSRLMQNSGGKGSYRSWRAALSQDTSP